VFSYGCTIRRKHRGNSQTACASSNSSTLLQAVHLSLSCALGLALHEIIVVRLASCANEEAGGEEGRRRSTKLSDGGDRVGERGGIDEGRLVEATNISI
jgi:hypothetical protein